MTSASRPTGLSFGARFAGVLEFVVEMVAIGVPVLYVLGRI